MGRRRARSLLLVVLVVAVVAAVRAARRRGDAVASDVSDAIWPPLTDAAEPTWVAPEGGACPVSHPVKAKVQSGIFHAPGSAFYDRTRPDRCYRDVAAAEADGLRAPVRGARS